MQDDFAPDGGHFTKAGTSNSYLSRVFNATTFKQESPTPEDATKKSVQFRELNQKKADNFNEDQITMPQTQRINLHTDNALFKTFTRTTD